MSWTSETLGEAIRKDRGLLQTGPFGSQLKQAEYTAEGVPVIMPKDIQDGDVCVDSVARVPAATADRLRRHRIKLNGIVLPRRGEITKRAFIRSEQEGWLCGTGCLKIETNGNVIWPKFLYYFMGTQGSVQWLERNAVGVTMGNLSTEIVSRFPVKYPDISIQRSIADILSVYDDLIINNSRRIELLESLARLLFKEWFIRLRYPGHEHDKIVNGMPNGWERKTLGDVCHLSYGKALPATKRIDGNVLVYGSSGAVGRHNTKFVAAPGIVVGRKGNVGSVFWTDDEFWPIDTAYFVAPQEVSLFLYQLLSVQSFENSDAAVPGLNRDYAHRKEIKWPPFALRDAFEIYIKPLFEHRRILIAMSDRLRRARDLLLPRLMDGRISV
jgi:type I restriction enzyme, S subunit